MHRIRFYNIQSFNKICCNQFVHLIYLQFQSQKELQAKIDKEKAIRQAQEAENKRRQEERRQEILERQRQGDQFNELPPPIDFSQVEEDPY